MKNLKTVFAILLITSLFFNYLIGNDNTTIIAKLKTPYPPDTTYEDSTEYEIGDTVYVYSDGSDTIFEIMDTIIADSIEGRYAHQSLSEYQKYNSDIAYRDFGSASGFIGINAGG